MSQSNWIQQTRLISLFVILTINSATTGQSTLGITGDSSLDELYVNGVSRPLSNGGDSLQLDSVSLDDTSDRLIAFHAQGNGWCSGVIASTDDSRLLSGYRFRCTAQVYNGWMNLGFEDYAWPIAHSVGHNDGTEGYCADWPQFPSVSPEADWIWTWNMTNSDVDIDPEVYCRGYMPVCDSSPCQNGGTCNPNGLSSICDCAPGYSGPFCETHLVQDCGDLLHMAPSDLIVREGWHHYCFLSTNDTNFLDFQCRQLIRGLPVYGDAEGLLGAGGNFGCWLAQDYPSDYLLGACMENYQHQRSLASCYNCKFLGVCIQLPPN